MAVLLVRVAAQDAALLRRVYGLGGLARSRCVPARIVVDAHVAQRADEIASIARRVGVPMLVDPQTYYLQDQQCAGDPWAALPFAGATVVTSMELMSTARQDRLVEQCVEYQLDHGATTLIPPYVHLEDASSGWIDVQAGLWRRTRRYLDLNGLRLPTVAVFAIGWRLLQRVSGVQALAPALRALTELAPTEVGLAASKVHAGAHPDERLADLLSMIRLLRRQHRVLAWQQGLLGEACVVAGADGYETGIGQRERCDLGQAMTNRRHSPMGAAFGPRPVYIPALKRAVPKGTLRQLRQHRDVWCRVLCDDHDCCAVGNQILEDARSHAIFSRARDLNALTQVQEAKWQWNRLATETAIGLDLAQRINELASRAGWSRIDTGALNAIHSVSDSRRQERRAHRVA